MTDRSSLAKRLIKDLVIPNVEIDSLKGDGDVNGSDPPSDGYVIVSFRGGGGRAQVQRATFSDVSKTSSEGISMLKSSQSNSNDQSLTEEGSFYGEAFWIGSDDEEKEEDRVASITEESDRSSQKEEEENCRVKMKISPLTALSRGLLNDQSEDEGPKKVNGSLRSCLGDSRAVYYGGSEDGRKMLRCRECGKHYRNDYSLRHHICLRRKEVWKKGDVPKELVNGQVIYFCPACAKPFRWMGNLTRHFYVHTGQRFFKCDICEKEFFSAYQVRRHMNSHTGMRYKCRVCEKPFTCVYACTWHMRQHSAVSGAPAILIPVSSAYSASSNVPPTASNVVNVIQREHEHST